MRTTYPDACVGVVDFKTEIPPNNFNRRPRYWTLWCTADIIRMYITDTLSSVREFREGAERKRIQQKHLKTRLKGQSPAVHFLKIHFTEAQIDHINIVDFPCVFADMCR